MPNPIDGARTVRRFFQDRDANKPFSNHEISILQNAIGADARISVKERVELLKNLAADFSIRERFTPAEKSLVRVAMEGIDTQSAWESLPQTDRAVLLEKAFIFDGEVAGVTTKATDVRPEQLAHLRFGRASRAIADAITTQLQSEKALARRDGRTLYAESADVEVTTISHRNQQTGRREVYGYEIVSSIDARPKLHEAGLASVSYASDNYYDADGRPLTRNPATSEVQFLGE